MKYLNNIDLCGNQLQNFIVQPLAVDPTARGKGQLICNTTLDVLRFYNGTAWRTLLTEDSDLSADRITSGTLNFDRLPEMYIGTTRIQKTSTPQPITGITDIRFSAGTPAADSVDLEVIVENGKRYLHTSLPFYSDDSVSAGGIGTSGGGGIGTVTGIKLGTTTYEPSAGTTIIELPYTNSKSDIFAGSSSIASAGAIYGFVQDAVGGLSTSTLTIQANGTSKGTYNPTSGAATTINITAADLGLGNAVHFLGQSTTEITEGGTQKPTIGGMSVTPSAGDVVLYGGKEFIWTTTGVWESFGDEGSYALKTRTISGGTKSGHTYGLAGGGSLEANRTITLTDATNTAIGQGVAAYNALPGYAKKFSSTITGNGSTAEFTVTHNIGNKDVIVSIYDNSYNMIMTDVVLTSTTACKINFATAPASGTTYHVVIAG